MKFANKPTRWSLWLWSTLLLDQLSYTFQQQQQPLIQITTTGGSSVSSSNAFSSQASSSLHSSSLSSVTVGSKPTAVKTSDELQRFEEWKRSPLFVEPFDMKVLTVPDVQLAFIRNATASDINLFREILSEAIETRKKFAPSVKLMFKYAGRLLTNFIKNRLAEMQLPSRIEPRPDFFLMLADTAQEAVDESTKLKRNYNKNLDTDKFRQRVEMIFERVKAIVDTAPMGGYLKWDQWVLFKEEPMHMMHNRRMKEVAADLFAVSGPISGRELSMFKAQRLRRL